MAPALGPGRGGPKRCQWSAGIRNLGEVDNHLDPTYRVGVLFPRPPEPQGFDPVDAPRTGGSRWSYELSNADHINRLASGILNGTQNRRAR
jgi:hypothetical protein